MKPLLLLITTALLCATKLPAQDINKNNRSQFGIKLGMNYSNIHFTNTRGNTMPATSPLIGAAAGFFLNVPISEALSFQPEYLVSMQGSKLQNDSAFRLTYFSLPVLLNLKVAQKFSLLGGGSFDLLMWAKEKARSTHESIKGLETRSLGLTGGIGYNITDDLNLQLRYLQSLNHIDDYFKEREFKNTNLQLSLGLKL